MESTTSFTARRSAASNLPQFQLPPPDLINMHHKYPAFAPINTSQAPNPNNVLTPPVGLPTDGVSPLSSSANSTGSSLAGIAPYNPLQQNFWPQQNPAYTFNPTPQMSTSYGQSNTYINRYSPSMNFPRNASSPSAGEALPPPPYELSLPPFPTSMAMSGSSGGAGLSSHTGQQQMPTNLLSSHQAASQAPQSAPLSASEQYAPRPPPTSSYQYNPSATPQQSSFPAYTQPPSQSQPSPLSANAPSNRISPHSLNPAHNSMPAPPPHYSRPSYNGYPLPALAGGPIMSNVHSPGGQMALVNGMGMGGYHGQNNGMPQHMYGGHPSQQQQQQQNDRPFKCDQCPQSFNRNHDLKRHTRIHLAVKPFPCGHCEKSFSRKDALKVCPLRTARNVVEADEKQRHILVKGCGKSGGGAALAGVGSQSPVDKSELLSDSADDSPELPKKEMA